MQIKSLFSSLSIYKENQPSAQAADANPSWCKSPNRQNQPIQQNYHNLDALKNSKIVYFMTESTISNRLGVVVSHYDSELFSMCKLYVNEPFKSYTEATPSGLVDQIWQR